MNFFKMFCFAGLLTRTILIGTRSWRLARDSHSLTLASGNSTRRGGFTTSSGTPWLASSQEVFQPLNCLKIANGDLGVHFFHS